MLQEKQLEGCLASLALSEELDTPDERTTALAGRYLVHLQLLSMPMRCFLQASDNAAQFWADGLMLDTDCII